MTPEKLELAYSEVTVPSTDGVQLKAWKIPAEKPSKSKIAVLQFHGNAENRSTHFLSVAWLAKEGVDVVAFDYRGYNGSSGEPSRKGLVDDGKAMLQWFEKQYPDSKRYIIGQSLGGAVAITALAKSQVNVNGLILESTFASYRGIARTILARTWIFWPFQWLPWLVLSGDEDPEDYVGEIKVPILVYHDRHDPVVPFEAGEKLYEKIPKSQLSFRPFDGNKHTHAFASDRESEIRALLQFIN